MILYKYLKPIVLLLFLFCLNTLIIFAEPIVCPKNSEIQQLKEKIIRLEAIQDNYSNNISLHSITIGIIMGGLVVLVGFSVYLQNKNSLAEYKRKQDNIDKNIIELDSKQKSFEQFTEAQKALIEKIVDEQTDLHFEIFDTLFHLSYLSYRNISKSRTVQSNIISITNNLLLFIISEKMRKYGLDESISSHNINDHLDKIAYLLNELNNNGTESISFKNNIEIAVRNFDKCLKYINPKDTEVKNRISEYCSRLKQFSNENQILSSDESTNHE